MNSSVSAVKNTLMNLKKFILGGPRKPKKFVPEPQDKTVWELLVYALYLGQTVSNSDPGYDIVYTYTTYVVIG